MKKIIVLIIILSTIISCKSKQDVNYFPAQINGLWGIFDEFGKEIVAPQFEGDFLSASLSDNVFRIALRKKGLKEIGYCDMTGNILISPMYLSGTNFQNDVAIVCEKNKYPIAINKKGEMLFEMKNAIATGESFNSNRMYVELVDNCGFIDKKGELVIGVDKKNNNEPLQPFRSGRFLNNHIIFDDNGKPIYENNKLRYLLNETHAIISLDEGYKIFDYTKDVALNDKVYSDIEELNYPLKLIVVDAENGLKGVINFAGEKVIDYEFDRIEFRETFILATNKTSNQYCTYDNNTFKRSCRAIDELKNFKSFLSAEKYFYENPIDNLIGIRSFIDDKLEVKSRFESLGYSGSDAYSVKSDFINYELLIETFSSAYGLESIVSDKSYFTVSDIFEKFPDAEIDNNNQINTIPQRIGNTKLFFNKSFVVIGDKIQFERLQISVMGDFQFIPEILEKVHISFDELISNKFSNLDREMDEDYRVSFYDNEAKKIVIYPGNSGITSNVTISRAD
jgi:hypothetical protein